MQSELPFNAQRCREEARRIRRDAEKVTDEKIRQKLFDVANQYDRLAENLERERR